MVPDKAVSLTSQIPFLVKNKTIKNNKVQYSSFLTYSLAARVLLRLTSNFYYKRRFQLQTNQLS